MSTRTRKREKKVQHGKHIRVLCLNFWLVHLTELWNVLIHHLRTCSPEIIMFLCCRSRRSFEVTTWHISHESTDSVSTNMNTRAHKHAHKESVLVWFREKITVECGSICMRSTRPIGAQASSRRWICRGMSRWEEVVLSRHGWGGQIFLLTVFSN